MPITQRNKIGMLEAMLFANAEPVETDRLAEAMRADPAEVLTLLEKLQSSSADCTGPLQPKELGTALEAMKTDPPAKNRQ